MNVRSQPYIMRRLRSVLFTLFNRLENNNDARFDANGEARFLTDLLGGFRGAVTLFDVGANVGEYSDILVRGCRERNLPYTVHAFEPTRSCFSRLTERFSADPGIRLNNVGVSDAAGETEIFYDAERSGFASLYRRDLSSLQVSMDRSERIRLVRLDEYIRTANVPGIDLLKIDIEGHEMAAFRGMGEYLDAGFVKAVQFEYGGANLDSRTTLRDLYALLESRGFVIVKLMRRGAERRPYTLAMENYQYGNFAALSPKHFPDLA